MRKKMQKQNAREGKDEPKGAKIAMNDCLEICIKNDWKQKQQYSRDKLHQEQLILAVEIA